MTTSALLTYFSLIAAQQAFAREATSGIAALAMLAFLFGSENG